MTRIVLVTGASSGIGKACADRLSRAGWIVYGASRRGTSSDGWQPLVMDVDDDAATAAGIAKILEHHNRLDAVVANAGWGLAGPVEGTPITDAKAQLETNFWGVVRVVQAALPVMRRQCGGRLVFVGSIGGVIGLPFQAFYSASKFALEGFTEALAHEAAPFGISVSILEPGNVKTDFTASRRDAAVSASRTEGETAPGANAESSAPDEAGNAYTAAFNKALGVMQRDEESGVRPDLVAAAIQQILDRRHPPRRMSVGKPTERVGTIAKRLMPYRLFERASRGPLGV